MEIAQERDVRIYFDISLILKGVVSFAEVVGGILALFIPISSITGLLMQYAQGELAEEPGDFIATHLIQLAQQFSIASGTFIAYTF